MSMPVRGTTASLLCSFEKLGYGRLVFESDFGGTFSVSSMPGMELLLCSSRGRDAFESDLSLLELLRWDDLRCSLSLLSTFSSLRDMSFLDDSRRRSGLDSLTFDGIIVGPACGDLTRGVNVARALSLMNRFAEVNAGRDGACVSA